MDRLENNLAAVRARARRAEIRAGLEPGSVRMVAVTKHVPPDVVGALWRLGQSDLGENRLQEALAKIAAVGPGPTWHLVGHLQSNKVRKALDRFAWIHSVDSAALLERIDRVLAENDRPAPRLLVQVNVSGETSKFGLAPEALEPILRRAATRPRLAIVGLMTLAPFDPDPERSRPAFRALRALRDEANREAWYRAPLEHLSMGMSGDFEVAIEEGATWVRIGTRLFDGV
ncbi:MAG: YggS family pyridoxal phosphate-dependent enzyme [Planctomycetes bacterium]|nr:YggS family pyridoxal phosphate-dependent enzyme [Planctomycetota bacterium]